MVHDGHKTTLMVFRERAMTRAAPRHFFFPIVRLERIGDVVGVVFVVVVVALKYCCYLSDLAIYAIIESYSGW